MSQSPSPPERRRPRRLEWPSDSEFRHKRPRNERSSLLWTDKYTPRASEDLCLAPQRITAVRKWIASHQSSGLLVLLGSPGIGKSTLVRCLAKELHRNLLEYTEPLFDSREGESALGCWERFLQSVSLDLPCLPSEERFETDRGLHNLILLDELPYLRDSSAEERFRSSLERLTAPTIFVYSDTVEGRANSIDKLVPNTAEVLQINPPTKARFGKRLRTILTREGMATSFDTNEFHAMCNGDLRFAIYALQCCGRRIATHPQALRDATLTPFHALGKILYAKKHPDTGKPLVRDPEGVVDSCGMDVARILDFLQYYGTDFFTDIDDLSIALEHYSDAAQFLDQPAAVSLASRTVAVTNTLPAKTKFRHLSGPPHIQQKQTVNRERMPSLVYAIDILPFAKRILPHGACIQLESYLHPSEASGRATNLQLQQKPDMDERLKREQEEILQEDDIIEDDDSVW